MNLISKVVCTSVLLLLVFTGFSQKKRINKEHFPSYFGVQVRPVLPTRFIGSPILTLSNKEYTTTIQQKIGYSFGGTLRAGFTNTLAFETGINFVQRNYAVRMAVPDSNVNAENSFSFISYDIPMNCLMYIKMSEKVYVNGSLGLYLSYKPTDVGIVTLPGSYFSFTHTGWVKHKTAFGINANMGVEFRSKKRGFYYIGGSACVPFSPVFNLTTQYKYQGFKNTLNASVDGSFFTIDFKFFFPNIKTRDNTFINGPIE
jgi:hypothetical protein